MTKSRRINGPRADWSAENLAALAARYPHEKTEHIARDLGMHTHQVYRQAKKMDLKKTPEYLASKHACRLRQGDNVGAPYRFPKGHVPANKGTRRPGYAPGRMAETQFKKGRRPEESRNYKPVGTLRINRDGYLERKVSDDTSVYPARRWVAEHRLVWEAANGPIPKGCICVFKPGMNTTEAADITADKLDCITRRENMARNTVHNLPKELAELVQLRGAVQRKINRRLKDERNTKG